MEEAADNAVTSTLWSTLALTLAQQHYTTDRLRFCHWFALLALSITLQIALVWVMSSPRSPSQTLLLGPPPVDFSPRLVPIPPSPALSSASPTTPPQSPGSQAEQAKAASTLTGIQVEVVAKVDKIHSQANTHPYSKLQQLQQARIVLNVTKEDLGTIGRKSTVKIGATIRDEIPEFSHSRTAASKKVALLEAAAQVFEDVVTCK